MGSIGVDTQIIDNIFHLLLIVYQQTFFLTEHVIYLSIVHLSLLTLCQYL